MSEPTEHEVRELALEALQRVQQHVYESRVADEAFAVSREQLVDYYITAGEMVAYQWDWTIDTDSYGNPMFKLVKYHPYCIN